MIYRCALGLAPAVLLAGCGGSIGAGADGGEGGAPSAGRSGSSGAGPSGAGPDATVEGQMGGGVDAATDGTGVAGESGADGVVDTSADATDDGNAEAEGASASDGGYRVSCSANSDCASSLLCGFEVTAGCGAMGTCVHRASSWCGLVTLTCACDGTSISVGCDQPLEPGYATKPVLPGIHFGGFCCGPGSARCSDGGVETCDSTGTWQSAGDSGPFDAGIACRKDAVAVD